MAQLLLSKSSSVADGRVTQSIICDGTAHGKSPAISGRDKEKEEMLNSSPDETLNHEINDPPLYTDLHISRYAVK